MTGRLKTFRDWLSCLWRPDFARCTGFGLIVRALVLLVVLALLSIPLLALLSLIVQFVLATLPYEAIRSLLNLPETGTVLDKFSPFKSGKAEVDQFEAIRNIGLGLAALIGVPFLIWRSVVAQAQADTAQRQADLAEQGLITDRLTKAVEGLGAMKTVKRQRRDDDGILLYAKGGDGEPDTAQPLIEEVTEPNIEVRIGAIYALERISKDSDRDHANIMEILCAYIRENAPAKDTRTPEQDGIARWRSCPKTPLTTTGTHT
ncbi:hypothetical protein [Rhodovulum sp. P5]|uniref:hypothetical protein n=1 Tax=Rhodovulum sp. P5 TaxID=1564506 RepID=UPI0012EC8CF8|nr:hypothetical protein [Rhodovulum sp. P5]